MKIAFLFCCCLLLVGCVQMFSPVVMEVAPNTYLLQTQGNMFASNRSMKNKLNKKANEVCKGKGFENLSQNTGLTNGKVYAANGMVVPVSISTTQMKVKCND